MIKLIKNEKIILIFSGSKQLIIHFLLVRIFLCSTKKRQRYLIEKNVCMFLGLQRLAKRHDDNGDFRSAMEISSKSYEYLNKFALYCHAKGIDQVDKMRQYS